MADGGAVTAKVGGGGCGCGMEWVDAEEREREIRVRVCVGKETMTWQTLIGDLS